jgi:hypothetical protein
VSLEKITESLINNGTLLQGEDLKWAAEQSLSEFKMNIKGVMESYHNFIFEIDVNPQQVSEAVASIKRLI